MNNSDRKATADQKTRNPYDDVGNIHSCLSKYFNGNPDTLPLKDIDYAILAALSVYFQGHAKQ